MVPTILGRVFGAGQRNAGGIGQGKEGLIYTFAGFFTAIAGVWFLVWGGEWALGYLFTQIFLMFGYFLILFPNRSLKPFEKSNTKFALLDITFRFTCG